MHPETPSVSLSFIVHKICGSVRYAKLLCISTKADVREGTVVSKLFMEMHSKEFIKIFQFLGGK